MVQYAVCGEGGETVWGDEKGSGKISMNLSPYVSIRFSACLPTYLPIRSTLLPINQDIISISIIMSRECDRLH